MERNANVISAGSDVKVAQVARAVRVAPEPRRTKVRTVVGVAGRSAGRVVGKARVVGRTAGVGESPVVAGRS